MTDARLPRPVLYLGLAGVLPQAICLILVHLNGEWYYLGITAGCFYAAAILSFLGGIWWMQGLAAGSRSVAVYGVAVAPGLAAWLCLLPWTIGWNWPGPSLLALGLVLLASPLVDKVLHRKLAGAVSLPRGWLRLRVVLAAALGALTVLLGLSA